MQVHVLGARRDAVRCCRGQLVGLYGKVVVFPNSPGAVEADLQHGFILRDRDVWRNTVCRWCAPVGFGVVGSVVVPGSWAAVSRES